MKIKYLGFTLIELIIVISIIGILSAVAIPRFMNMTTAAQQAAVAAVAGSLASASANNYAARSYSTTFGSAVANCTDVAALLQGGTLPTGYTIAPLSVGVGTTVTCTLTGPGTQTATFSATGIS